MNELKKLLENAGMKMQQEAVKDWTQQTEFWVEDDSGNSYQLFFEDQDGEEVMFVRVNERNVAWAIIGGGGFTNPRILDAGLLLDAIFAFANNNAR